MWRKPALAKNELIINNSMLQKSRCFIRTWKQWGWVIIKVNGNNSLKYKLLYSERYWIIWINLIIFSFDIWRWRWGNPIKRYGN